jgi:hypothetical protein
MMFLFSCFSLQAITLDSLQKQLMSQTLLRGEFTQTKNVKMFKKPLLSNGSFLLTQSQGLVWQQQSPFPVSLILTKDKLRQQFSDKPADIIQAKDNPMVFYFSHLFLSLFQGDIKALQAQFDLALSNKKQSWKLALTPKSPPLSKVFSTITIEGDQYIKSLVLAELNGDSSVILFNNTSEYPRTLTKQEKNAFKF